MGTDDFRDQQTDTHLAKWYNDILSQIMLTCNATRISNGARPHIDSLRAFHAAVDTLAANCEFLFENTHVTSNDGTSKVRLITLIEDEREKIHKKMLEMYVNPSAMTRRNLYEATTLCEKLHERILAGLQQRKMLVRVSSIEPRGKDTIKHWNTKAALRKGDLRLKKSVGGETIV